MCRVKLKFRFAPGFSKVKIEGRPGAAGPSSQDYKIAYFRALLSFFLANARFSAIN
jgi:hypothetical protein